VIDSEHRHRSREALSLSTGVIVHGDVDREVARLPPYLAHIMWTGIQS
jgi:hypothetical protein